MKLNFRPLAAIAVVLALIGVGIVVLGIGGSGGRDSGGVAARATTRMKLVAKLMPRRLSAPISGEVVVPMAGRLAVVGGLDASGASASGIFSLDPRNAALHSTGVLPQPLHDAAGATVGSRALLFGGGSNASTDTVESVPARGDAHVVGRLPAPRSDLVAAGVGGRVYVLGGYDGTTPDPNVLATSDGRHFTQVAKLPVPVRYPAVAASGGSIFLLGGQTAGGGPTDTIQRMDPKTGSSRIVGRLPAAVDHATALTLRGHTYVLGGSTSHGPSDTILELDPQSGATKAAGRLPMAVAGAAGAVSGGRGYLVGGTGRGGGSLASVIRLELKTLKVKAATSPSAARKAVAAALPGTQPASAGTAASSKRPFDGLLMIADRGNNRLIVVNTAKKVLWRYPAPGRPAPKGGFYFPDDAFFTHHGTGIITNQEENETIVELAYPSGKVTRSYGHPGVIGSGQGYLHEPDDAYLLRDGTITVADAQNCRILSIPPHGRASQIGTTGSCSHDPPRTLGSPNGDTPLANGDLLVSEINGSWVDELTPKGKVRWSVHLPTVGYPSDPQQLGPNRYLLADYSTPGGIYEFNRSGHILWSYHPSSGKGMLDRPSLAERLPNGLIVANDDYRHRVVIIDPKTKRIVWQYGSADHPGRGPNHLNIPDGIDLLAPGGRTPTHPFTG